MPFPQDVLVLEDEFLIAAHLEDALRRLGASRVRTAMTAAAALTSLQERLPDFVVLDVKLGEANSLDVATRLKELGIPFLFVTGYEDEGRLDGLRGAPRLTKPYTEDELRQMITRVCQHAGHGW